MLRPAETRGRAFQLNIFHGKWETGLFNVDSSFHAAGEKRVEIRVIQKEETVRIEVFNSGNPIPEEDLEKIWQRFYKVDKAHTREYGGNGIGLSIVKAIMESFHQDYGVQNYKNGVKFWFELDAKNNEI